MCLQLQRIKRFIDCCRNLCSTSSIEKKEKARQTKAKYYRRSRKLINIFVLLSIDRKNASALYEKNFNESQKLSMRFTVDALQGYSELIKCIFRIQVRLSHESKVNM